MLKVDQNIIEVIKETFVHLGINVGSWTLVLQGFNVLVVLITSILSMIIMFYKLKSTIIDLKSKQNERLQNQRRESSDEEERLLDISERHENTQP